MPFVSLTYNCYFRYVHREGQREYFHLQEIENNAKGIRQTKNPCLSFSSSVLASADGGWGEGTLGYHSLALCEHQLMEVGEKGPLVIIL
jgi:hypothetical protein